MPEGVVKWFSPEKGYGFITPDDGDRDYFVHHSDINMQGYRTLEQGQRVQFEPRDGDRGPLAGNVTLL
ncbi:MAG TPA: cold shock domain-containing protein [Miltoncostaeaceae bacterium]|nr:cold shock domain-containing protein [Miltoncostaeaceae bacterium]